MNTLDTTTAYKLSKVFLAPQEQLFNSFIDEAILKKIWGVSRITVDARPGGHARGELEIDNENWNFTITYKEVLPHKTLRWIVHFDRFQSKEIRVTLRFRRTAGGTEVTVRQENFESSQERDANRQAWEGALKTLEGLL